MASLQTLRDKGGVIVAVIIALALVSFVLGDLLTSGGVLFGGGDDSVGKIDKNSISRSEYVEARYEVEQYLKVTQGVQNLSADQTKNIEQMVWQNLLTKNAIAPALEAEGMTVSAEELETLISTQFEPAFLQQLFMQMDSDPTGTLNAYWSYLTGNLKNQALLTKYMTILREGNFVTSSEAKFMSNLQGADYKVRFVGQKLSTIADSLVQISDSEISKYYEANKENKWKKEGSRNISYVAFEVLPSASDYQNAEKKVNDLKEQFETTENIAQFVNLNSDGAINQVSGGKFDTRYYKKGELSATLNDFVFGEDNSGVLLTDIVNDEYTLARVVGTKVVPDSVEVSVIILDPTSTALADSLHTILVKNPSRFAEIASEFSVEPSVEQNSGEFGMLDPQSLPTELSTPIIEMAAGEVKVVNFPQSIMIAKVGKKVGESEKVQVGVITKQVTPSTETRNATYNKASSFLSSALKDNFLSVAGEEKLPTRPATLVPSTWELPGYASSREVVRWAYNAKFGDVSPIMEFGDTYIVATVVSITEDGYTPEVQVAAQIRKLLADEKKGAMIAETMTGSVDQIAAKLDLEVLTNDKVTYTTAMANSNFGTDYAFAGGVAALSAGQTSKPIVGEKAVYVVEVVEVNSTPVSEDMIKQNITLSQEMMLNQTVSQELFNKFEIEDTRYKFL